MTKKKWDLHRNFKKMKRDKANGLDNVSDTHKSISISLLIIPGEIGCELGQLVSCVTK